MHVEKYIEKKKKTIISKLIVFFHLKKLKKIICKIVNQLWMVQIPVVDVRLASHAFSALLRHKLKYLTGKGPV